MYTTHVCSLTTFAFATIPPFWQLLNAAKEREMTLARSTAVFFQHNQSYVWMRTGKCKNVSSVFFFVTFSACGVMRTGSKQPVLTAYFPVLVYGILGKDGLFVAPPLEDCHIGLTGVLLPKLEQVVLITEIQQSAMPFSSEHYLHRYQCRLHRFY